MDHKLKLGVLAALACLIVIVAAYTRLVNLPSESLDGDELFSRRVALASPPLALDLIEQDLVHPPLYYFALQSVLPLTGTGATGIRVLSLLCGVASVVVLLFWGIALPARAAFLAAGLTALNTTDIFYSQQARSYALYGLLVCLLILWALVLERYQQRLWYWSIGTILMVLTVYTHYVGALFIGAVFLSTVLSNVRAAAKIRMTVATAIAALSFVPWMILEVSAYKSKHGVGEKVAWQGAPTGYDLRATWADFMGLPQIHGGTMIALSIGAVLAGFAIFRRTLLSGRIAALLATTAILPPLALFATSFKPLNMTFFGERHLLPSIFATLILAAVGLEEISSLSSKRTLVWAVGAVCLFSLQIAALSKALSGPTRQPYSVIAADLKKEARQREPVYTTWPYGTGETVNFYLGTDRVQPLPALPDQAAFPKEFVILYRPAVPTEQNDVDSFLHKSGATLNQCRYYSALGSTFGTRMCLVN